MSAFFIIEASHLFRAGEIYSTQLYVVDVINYIATEVLNVPVDQSWVLFGSTKENQAEKYIAAVERNGIEVIRMVAIDSRINLGSKFYKPSVYLESIMNSVPVGSDIVLVGFHNNRFEDLFRKYSASLNLHLCAWTTRSKSMNDMKIPDHFKAFLKSAISLDNHVDGIKDQYRKQRVESEA
jgi:CTP:phosphocholine cytidylyltransferase-like protein